MAADAREPSAQAQGGEETKAASKIQAIFRGSKVRKETGGDAAITVGMRLRPFVPHELKKGQPTPCIGISDNVMKVVPEAGLDEKDSKQGPWKFDRIMDSSLEPSSLSFVDNAKCYELMGRRMISDVLQGFNTCLFCYGQTGTGKTTTIMGDEHNGPGVLRRLLDDIFEEADKMKRDGSEVKIEIQMLEVYNEDLHDLLLEKGKPPAKIQTHILPGGVTLSGATTKEVHSASECQHEIDYGNSQKTMAATAMNPQSSRGHTVFKLVFKKSGGPDGAQLSSEVYFADLAGHENIKTTAVTGDRLKELTFINGSLMWLQNALHTMAEASAKKGHKVDFSKFRNSKLTLLLSNALTGNSKTSVIVTLSPSLEHFDTSLSSIKFAMEVKGIKVKATSNTGTDPKVVIAKLEKENAELKEKLAAAGGQESQQLREELAELREQLAVAEARPGGGNARPLGDELAEARNAEARPGGGNARPLGDELAEAQPVGPGAEALRAELAEARGRLAEAEAQAAGGRGGPGAEEMLRGELGDLKEQLAAAQAQLAEKDSRVLEDSRAREKEAMQLREQLAAASKQAQGSAALQDEVAGFRSRAAALPPLREEVSELKNKLELAQARLGETQALKDEVAVLREQLAVNRNSGVNDSQALREEITRLGERLASTQSLKTEVGDLKVELAAARSGSNSQEARALRDEVARLRQQLAAAEEGARAAALPPASPAPRQLESPQQRSGPAAPGALEAGDGMDAAMEQMMLVLELSKKNVDLFSQLLETRQSPG